MDIPRLQKTLEAAGFTVQWFPTAQAAKEALVARFAGKTIGMGGSVTLRDLGLYEALSQRGTVYWHWQQPGPETLAQAAKAQVYLTSVNALAETGQLVNIDGTGNRVAALCFGPTQVVVVAGMNKVAGDLDGAMRRAREVAAPMNAQRFPLKTPCVANGLCADCKGPDSICAQIVITRMCKPAGRIKVVLVGEDLGF